NALARSVETTSGSAGASIGPVVRRQPNARTENANEHHADDKGDGNRRRLEVEPSRCPTGFLHIRFKRRGKLRSLELLRVRRRLDCEWSLATHAKRSADD